MGSFEKILFLHYSIYSPLGLKVEKKKKKESTTEMLWPNLHFNMFLHSSGEEVGATWKTLIVIDFVWKWEEVGGGLEEERACTLLASQPVISWHFSYLALSGSIVRREGIREEEDRISRGVAGAEEVPKGARWLTGRWNSISFPLTFFKREIAN